MALSSRWKELIAEESKKDYFQELKRKVTEKRAEGNVFPESSDILNALDLCPFEKVKVVILGQDPYPGKGHAHGLAFSTLSKKLPPSLKIIYDEITRSFFDAPFPMTGYNNGDLTGWAKQGVLLLNTILTVDEGNPLSHKGFGWEILTEKIIDTILEEKESVIWLVWGKEAKKAVEGKKSKSGNQGVLLHSHPQAQNYNRDNAFVGCNHFYSCNKYLIENGLSPISWNQVEDPNIFDSWSDYLEWKKQTGEVLSYYEIHEQKFVYIKDRKVRRDLITHPI